MVKKQSAGGSLATSRIEQWYNKIVIGFVVLTVLLIALIAYFSFSKTNITVTSAQMQEEVQFTVSASELEGIVLLTDVESTTTVNEFATVEEKNGRATGTVTLVNNYSQSQPLVETTRLLSESGVLFRTQETVTVPAGGSVEVTVAADEEGPAGDIGPSRFEVVALWDGLKDQIYGTSEVAMTGGTVKTAVVSATDIANAQETAKANLQEEAVNRFRTDIESRSVLPTSPYLVESAYVVTENTSSQSAQPGDVVEELQVTTSASMAGAVINRDKLSEYVKNQLSSVTADGLELVDDQKIENVTVTITEVNEDNTDATLTISLLVDMKIGAEHEVLNRKNLINKTADEVRNYLTAFDEVESVEVRFSPFWIKRTPAIADNIIIQVQ